MNRLKQDIHWESGIQELVELFYIQFLMEKPTPTFSQYLCMQLEERQLVPDGVQRVQIIEVRTFIDVQFVCHCNTIAFRVFINKLFSGWRTYGEQTGPRREQTGPDREQTG